MTKRRPCSAAPGPLEAYAAQYAEHLGTRAPRRGFREYLQGLLVPRDRPKTLTGLVGTDPVVGAPAPSVQRLQFFLSESPWAAEAINRRRLDLLVADPATAPQEDGVLVIDDSGDRKAGTKTAHVARPYLGSIGTVEGGIVAVTSRWADERVYYPFPVKPYTPAARRPKGKADPDLSTKPQLAVALVDAALEVGGSFRAVVADGFEGENATFAGALTEAGLPFVLALKPASGIWAPAAAVHTPEEAARERPWGGPDDPGDWTPVVRRFRDGHEEIWWAADLRYGPYGPDKARRVEVATTDPATLPPLTTWYLATNLPHPDAPHADEAPVAPADLAEIIRLYGLRTWVEQGYTQLQQELGWADFMVRADQAIRRHWHLVCCAFSFCWRAWFTTGPPRATEEPPAPADSATSSAPEWGKKGARPAGPATPGLLATDAPAGARLARPLDLRLALLARLVERAPAT